MFGTPEIAVADDEADNRLRQRHVRLFEFGVEVGECVRHLGAAHRVDPFLGQVLGTPDRAVALLEPRKLLGRVSNDIRN
jgi:hypothetical protein